MAANRDYPSFDNPPVGVPSQIKFIISVVPNAWVVVVVVVLTAPGGLGFSKRKKLDNISDQEADDHCPFTCRFEPAVVSP